jgi:hypothetical protein
MHGFDSLSRSLTVTTLCSMRGLDLERRNVQDLDTEHAVAV